MILYPLSEQNRPSAIRELVYNLEFPPSLITLARTVGLNSYYRGFKDNRKLIKVTVRFSTFK